MPLDDYDKIGLITWGSVSWLLHYVGPHLAFEGVVEDPVRLLTPTGYRRGFLSMLPPLSLHAVDARVRCSMFSTIASVIAWCIRKARCLVVLSNKSSSTTDILASIWSELIHSADHMCLQNHPVQACESPSCSHARNLVG